MHDGFPNGGSHSSNFDPFPQNSAGGMLKLGDVVSGGLFRLGDDTQDQFCEVFGEGISPQEMVAERPRKEFFFELHAK